jgi:glycine cleavage system aminomethyltransferase T
VSLDFLAPSPGGRCRSPMERQALAAGAQLEGRGGWNVAARFDGLDAERERARSSVGFADMSHLGKVEVQGAAAADLGLGRVTWVGGTCWCPYSPTRAIALCQPGELAGLREGLAGAVDVTTTFAALAIEGLLARELFARFTALDLRDPVTPVHAFRPGSVARTPGAVVRQSEERWLMLFGAALGQYVWTVVADAAGALGGGPIGVDALTPVGPEVTRA